MELAEKEKDTTHLETLKAAKLGMERHEEYDVCMKDHKIAFEGVGLNSRRRG